MRLFAGIELDDVTRAYCVDVVERLQKAYFQARYEVAEKMHITLAFLGVVDPAQLTHVEQALAHAAERTASLDLVLDKIGGFPNERRPRIIYVGSRNAGAQYRRLTDRLRDAYRDLGFGFDDDAVAHVTIARVKGGSDRPLPMLDLEPVTLRVREIVLFESLQHEGTTRYAIRTRCALG